MANWSAWLRFEVAIATAPRLPGVYMARQGPGGAVVRRHARGTGRQRHPQGTTGRLGVYASGKGIVSGLGEAASDRALADPEWRRERLAEVELGDPMRATEWGRAAIARAGLYIRWAMTPSGKEARELEGRVTIALGGTGLWSRSRYRVLRLSDLGE